MVRTAGPLVRLHDVAKSYSLGSTRQRVFEHVDLEVRPGDFLVMYGPSGSGKTTLLNLAAGIDSPDQGQVVVRGHDLARLSERSLTAYRRRFVGYVFQFYNLIPTLTAAENVAFPLELVGKRTDGAVRSALQVVGLAGKADRFPAQLSGGEQQRVAIARALVKRPLLLAADEPTGNLDATTSRQVVDLLKDLNRRHGLTILLATHDPELAKAGNRIVEIADGRVRERSA